MTMIAALPGNKRVKHRSNTVRCVEKLLKATGLPWSLEVGTKHITVWLNGTKIAAMCKGRAPEKDDKQIASRIRQYMRQHPQ